MIKDAIPIVQKVADHINKNIKEAENMKKFMAISSQGATSLLKAHRTLIKEGLLRDESKKKNFHCYLFSDIIIILSDTKSKNKANLLVPQFQVRSFSYIFYLTSLPPHLFLFLFPSSPSSLILFIKKRRIKITNDGHLISGRFI